MVVDKNKFPHWKTGSKLKNKDMQNESTEKDIEFIDDPFASQYGVNTKVDYAFILLRQIDRIAKHGSYINTYNITDDYISAIEVLEMLLSPYFDKDYNASFETLKKRYNNDLENTPFNQRGAVMEDLNVSFAKEKLRFLMAVMVRRRLLPEFTSGGY